MPMRKITKTVEVEQELCKCGVWFDRYFRQIPVEIDYLADLKRPYGFSSSVLPGSTITSPGECPECWDKEIDVQLQEYHKILRTQPGYATT